MITSALVVLAVCWLVLLRSCPQYFARRRQSTSAPHYHYYVCDDQELPTWRRKSPTMTPNATRR